MSSATLYGVAITIAFGAFALYSYIQLYPRPIPGIPFNIEATSQVLGDIPARKAWYKSHGEVRRWYQAQCLKHNSPIAQVFINPLNGEPSVLLCDHREIRDILMRRHGTFDRGARERQAFGALLPEQFLSIQTPTAKFKFHRELMKDLMLPPFLNNMNAPEIFQKTMNLVQLWQIKSRKSSGKPFDAKGDIGRATFDIIMAVAFGLDDESSCTQGQYRYTRAKDDETTNDISSSQPAVFATAPLSAQGQAILDLTDSIHIGVTSMLPYLHSWVALRLPPLRHAVKLKEELIRGHINAAVAGMPISNEEAQEKAKTALELLVLRERSMAQKTGRRPNYHGRYVYDQLLGYLIGGNDTTSNTLAWGLIYLADTEGPQSKLRISLQEAFEAAVAELRSPTVDEILKMNVPYLEAVIEEIMRLSIVIPVVARRATQDTTVLGHRIPKGTEVEFIMNGPGFLKPPFYVDGEQRTGTTKESPVGDWDENDINQFVPDRWLDRKNEGQDSFNALKGPMLTFGAGPRGCYGKRLAYMEMRIIVVLLIWHFEFLPILPNRREFGILENITTEPSECLIRLRVL
ncbi:cytochrome P450 [Phaeosphaeria sp. MPI-PUGE-AT-0046c]|nr:cytochrome P450 [Phaeosphaeria sp. MPI-PUGE-AT-0046c]